MSETATTHTGPLGSTVHILHADANTIAELAGVDWSRHFGRVCLDPVRGVITLMSPSRPHEDLTGILDVVVDAAGSALAGAAKSLRSLRLRGPGEPAGTGMEPDCTFYVGERARGYFAALADGEAAVDAFVERTAPDLVVEVEITHADAGKAEHATVTWEYASCGVSTATRGRESCEQSSSLCSLGGSPAFSIPRRCSKASLRTTCAKRWKGCGLVGILTNARRPSPESCAGGDMRACGYARSRRNTPPTEQLGLPTLVHCWDNTTNPQNYRGLRQPR